MATPANLKEFRKAMRSARKSVATPLRKRWNDQISAHIFETPEYRESKRIAGFLAFDGEADPRVVMDQAIEDGKQVFVPLLQGKNKPLLFVEWFPDVKLENNRFGIKEPVGDENSIVPATSLELVITPLVAFDAVCNRIGVGGGFYDRTFEFLNQRSEHTTLASGIAMIGFAFELQKLDAIHVQPWDVGLSGVATESKLYRPHSV
jgi:5-formyltetrahydrofolate cyclo-ligase